MSEQKDRHGPPLPEGPVCHEAPLGRSVPLVFAGDAPPSMETLTAGVRAVAEGGSSADGTGPAQMASGGAFGSRQRWSLIRIQWSAPRDAPLALVRRTRFITRDEVASWSSAPPEDAVELPRNTVALVDGELPPEVTAFYVVLAREEGWRPLCLSPVPAPFAVEGAIFRLGDVAGQLRAHLDARLDQLEAGLVGGADRLVELDLLEGVLPDLPEVEREARAERVLLIRANTEP